MKKLTRTALLLLLSLAMVTGQASTIPDVIGLYSGGGGLTFSPACLAKIPPGNKFARLNLVVKQQNAGQFRGTGTLDLAKIAVPFKFTGAITAPNGFAASFSTPALSASLSGSIEAGIITLAVTGTAPVSGPTCSFAGITRLKVDNVIPGLSPGNLLTTSRRLGANLRQLRSIQNTRIQSRFQGRGLGGARPLSDGFLLQNELGRSAGEGLAAPLGVWGSYTSSNSSNDFSTTAYDGRQNTVFVGADIRPWDALVVGLAVGREEHELDTDFNDGAQTITGYTVSPYLGYQLAEGLSLSLSGGVTEIDIDQHRTENGDRISSKVDSRRWFWSGGFDANTQFGNWLLNGRFGLLWTNETQEAFTERGGSQALQQLEQHFGLSQWQLGGELAYVMGDWEPYLGAQFERDYHRTELSVDANEPQPADDADDVLVSLGLRYFSASGVSAAIEWSSVLDRSDYSEDMLNLLLRADF